MCDVHLIEHARERRETLAYNCCYCGGWIGGRGVYISGELDDGTPGTYGFAYHADCADDMIYDPVEIAAGDGCFNYGEPVVIPEAQG